MPRSSRHKSHKHSSKDAKEHSESEREDVKKMNDRSNVDGSVIRSSKDSGGSSEKRKLSSSGKDLSARGNGEEYVALKRRKEKADDRWSGGGDEKGDVVKELKGESSRIDGDKSKPLADSKSRSSKRHENGSEKREENAGVAAEKAESKSSTGRVDSKRKSEKDSGLKEAQQSKDSKDKERGIDRERRIQEIKREKEAAVDGEASRKQGLHSVDFSEERQGKRGRENTEWPVQEELRNPELEKELERRMRKRSDGSSNRDKFEDDVKESEDGRLSSRGERAKDGRYKDEKHKDGSSGDKHREDGDRGNRHRDDKHREDGERDGRRRDAKYREDGDKEYRQRESKHREDGERDTRHKDDKYCEDGERDSRHKDDKYREDGDRDKRQRDDKYREDGGRDIRHRDDKYREDGDRDNRHRHEKYHDDGDRDYRQRGDKYREDGERDDRHRDDRHLEDSIRDSRNREEKNWEDGGRDSRHREGMQRDNNDKDKRLRDVKYRDERSSRDRTSDKSDMKHLRDEGNAAELHPRKSNNRDASPKYDDQSSRYKDDKGRRRTSDKEDHGEIRTRSTKEQNYDSEKKSLSSVGVELGGDRGRSNSHTTGLEITSNHSRRKSSPSSSSHAIKDHYRLSKQEESKSKDYVREERIRHNLPSSKEYAGATRVAEKASLSCSIEKHFPKDDNHLGEFCAERCPKEDGHASPLQMVDKSPSSTSTDRRHLNRSSVRRSLDIEDSGQRSGGSRDGKNHSGREGRGSREFPMETLPGDEQNQVDGDNFSVSSPFTRTSHLSTNSRSLLPPPHPFRMGVDGPLGLGSLEDNNRGKPNNRHRRIGDPSIGRVQGSAWRGVPNWPSTLTNGFIPFQHGPPPVGFHPAMQQFPAPPMFGVRPSMELNQSGIPYHVPDGDRFSGRGRPLGWRNPVDDSCPPPIHGWDANNSVFGDESHMYGRLNWDHNRSLSGGRVWETSSGTMWKGHNSGASTEFPSAPQKGDYSANEPADEVWPGQSGLQSQNDKKQPSIQVDNIDDDLSNDALEKNTVEAPKTIPEEMPNLSRKDGPHLSHLYLSMLDISPDLTQPELYSQYTNLLGVDQDTFSVEDESKFLLVEEPVDATVNTPNKTSSASLFPTLNDSVLQKAMSLYQKVREEFRARNGDEVPVSNVENLESAATLNQVGAGSNDKPGEGVRDCDPPEAVGVASALNKLKIEVSTEITTDETDEPVLADGQEKWKEAIADLNEVKMESDVVPEQGRTLESIVEDKSASPENAERSDAQPTAKVEEVNVASDSKAKLHDAKCSLLLFSDVSTDACEVVVPESVESGSVNLSRIHQSPESTH